MADFEVHIDLDGMTREVGLARENARSDYHSHSIINRALNMFEYNAKINFRIGTYRHSVRQKASLLKKFGFLG